MWITWITSTFLVIAIALGVWQGVHYFVQRYQVQGIPVAAWYRRDRYRGHISVGLASVLSLFLALNLLLQQQHVPWTTWIAVMGTTALLTIITWTDVITHRIPNPLITALMAWGGLQWVLTNRPDVLQPLLGVLIGGSLFLLIALIGRGAMGMGDVKLAAALGALVGFPAIVPALMVGIIAGGVAALVLLLTRRVGRKDYIAYGPYLALGGWLVFLQITLDLLPWSMDIMYTLW